MIPEIRPGIRRLLRLVTRRGLPDDAEQEIRLHLQLRTQQLMAEGLSAADARAEAEYRFGAVDDERRRLRAYAARRQRRLRWRDALDQFRGDLRYGLRTLRRDAGFTAFALAIMALGIGASATVFSLVNGVLLRPLPFRDPGRIVWVANIGDNGTDEWRLQVAHLVDLGTRSRTVAEFGGYYAYYSIGDAVLGAANGAQRLTSVPVTCTFLALLGVTPQLGRGFSSDECLDSSAPTALLTDHLWREEFGANRSVVDSSIVLNGRAVRVIGVLPASFDFGSVFTPGVPADLFVPYALSEQNSRSGNSVAVVGRLAPGATVAQVRTELTELGKDLTAEFRRRNTLRPRVSLLGERVNGRFRPALIVLGFAVAGVMLIVALNLASLQIARMMARSREVAVRLALGASRARLIAQALTESVALAAGGTALGVTLGVVATRYVSRMQAFDMPLLSRVGVDIPALAIAAGIAMVTAIAIGALPALSAPAAPNDALKEGARGTTRGAGHARVRSVLVVTEIGAALVLLVASSLLLRSFVHALDAPLGFAPAQVARLRVDPGVQLADLPASIAYYDGVLARIRALPGVTDASVSDLLPFTGDRSRAIPAEGKAYERGKYPEGFTRYVGTNYFRTMGIPLRAGRDMTDGDGPGAAPVVVINESMAHLLWPGEDAVGKRILQAVPMTVVGVVGDVRHTALESPFTGEIYFPMRQNFIDRRVHLVVRTTLPLSQLAPSARAALEAVAPDAARNQWSGMQELVDAVAAPRRFVVVLLGGFALFAVVLAALGIYALVSYGVTQRRKEIGIRIALGASAGAVRLAIVRGTLWLAAAGAALGIVGAALVTPAMGGLLFGVSWNDPMSFGVALALLFVVAGTAGVLPAHRAARVDPNTALRDG